MVVRHLTSRISFEQQCIVGPPVTMLGRGGGGGGLHAIGAKNPSMIFHRFQETKLYESKKKRFVLHKIFVQNKN